MNSQNFSTSEQLARQLNLFFARLMSPLEMRSSVKNRPDLERLSNHWFLCGDVRSTMFQTMTRMAQHDVPVRITGFTSPAGASYAVITHQFEGAQHRFLLPLYETKVRKFLSAIEAEPLGFLFGNECQEEAFVVDAASHIRGFKPLLGLPNPPQERSKAKSTIEEFPRVVACLLNVNAVPTTIPGVQVGSVSMSVLLPSLAKTSAYGERAGALQ